MIRINTLLILTAAAKLLAADHSGLPIHGPYFPCDDRIIEDRWQVERFVVPLQRHAANPLIIRDHPWEGTGPLMQGSVLRDPEDQLFKMWYLVWDEQAYKAESRLSYNICYAESKDGLIWRKPSLGLFSYGGSKANNLILLGRNKTQGIDVEPAAKSCSGQEKWIAIHNDSGGVFLSTTADGRTFHADFHTPIVSYHSDTHNNFVYDEVKDRWLMFVRPLAYAGSGLQGVGRRRVAIKESRDLKTWTPERTVLVPEEGDADHFYGMTVFRCGDLFWGALQRYETVKHHVDCELVWSADGYLWHRLPQAAQRVFLTTENERWDSGMVFLADRPVPTKDELWFYYGASDTPHDRTGQCAIGLATTKQGRLIGARSGPGQNGRMLTRPLIVTGDLYLNAAARGEIKVQVTGVHDEGMPGWTARECTPFTGDSTASKITWGARSLADLRGQPVRLRFYLDRAALFSFDFH